MAIIDEYRRALSGQQRWEKYLMEHSNLPGPRGNLELAYAVTAEGNGDIFDALLAHDNREVSENTPEVFVVFCGVVGLGSLLRNGDFRRLETLRSYANDPRWRIREAVAIALQICAPAQAEELIGWMQQWAQGSLLEQRAAVAALCEPSFLTTPHVCQRTLEILGDITARLARQAERKTEAFRILRQALGYAWSVAVAAAPQPGKAAFESWLDQPDADIRWVMKENLSKSRLLRMDSAWVQACEARLKNAAER